MHTTLMSVKVRIIPDCQKSTPHTVKILLGLIIVFRNNKTLTLEK